MRIYKIEIIKQMVKSLINGKLYVYMTTSKKKHRKTKWLM